MDESNSLKFQSRQNFLRIIVLVSTSILAYIAIVQPWSLRQINLSLSVGDVAPQDLHAPRNILYVSDVLTEDARKASERAVAPVYNPPDPGIARTQSELLSANLQSISTIRNNSAATLDEKLGKISELQNINLQPSSQTFLLLLSDSRWEQVQIETFAVLEQAMRNPVRTEDLDTVRKGLSSLVSLSLTEKETGLVVELISPIVVANSFYSPELTATARQAARDAVEPITQSFVIGQTIVSRGQIIKAVDLEALTKLGLIQTNDPVYYYLGAAALVLISAVFSALYFFRRKQLAIFDLRMLILLAILFLVFLFGVRVSAPNRTVIPYIFPIAGFALLVSTLLGTERGMVFGLLMSLLASYGMPDALALFPYYTLSSLCGVLAIGQARRVGQFLYAAIAISVSGAAMVAAYRFPFTSIDWIGLATLIGASLIAGILSAIIALPLQYLLSQFLGITTALQLLEVSRPDSPLLNYFLQRAPGTYQHCLQVANLAEQAAESIQADTLLTRVGALFHDVGKSANPLFFIENQPSSQTNSHDDLEPEESAQTIIRHVPDGLEMARKHRLPRRLFDFIAEHHGTLITRYQHNRAIQAANGDHDRVDENRYRYPGPKPRSKETAILMFADGVEARARAERPQTNDEMRTLIQNVIERCQKDGQLDNSPITQRDLSKISESFLTTLRVTFHPRLEYPKDQPADQRSDNLEGPIDPASNLTKKKND